MLSERLPVELSSSKALHDSHVASENFGYFMDGYGFFAPKPTLQSSMGILPDTFR